MKPGTCEKIQEALALLKVVKLGKRQIENGQARPIRNAFDELDKRIARYKKEHEAGRI